MARTRRGDRSREVGDLEEEEGAGRGVACGKRGRRVAHGGIVKIKDPPTPKTPQGSKRSDPRRRRVAKFGPRRPERAAWWRRPRAPQTRTSARVDAFLWHRVCEPSAAMGGPEAPPASLPRGARHLDTQRGGDRV